MAACYESFQLSFDIINVPLPSYNLKRTRQWVRDAELSQRWAESTHAGLPERVAVPSPLSTNLTTPGSFPLDVIFATGSPEVVIVKVS